MRSVSEPKKKSSKSRRVVAIFIKVGSASLRAGAETLPLTGWLVGGFSGGSFRVQLLVELVMDSLWIFRKRKWRAFLTSMKVKKSPPVKWCLDSTIFAAFTWSMSNFWGALFRWFSGFAQWGVFAFGFSANYFRWNIGEDPFEVMSAEVAVICPDIFPQFFKHHSVL